MAKDNWTIGELAAAAGVTVRTLRHYDAVGLLAPEERSDGGHRRYGRRDVDRLYRILALRDLGFGLGEIGSHLQGRGGSLREATRARLEQVEGQLAAGERLRARLADILELPGTSNEPPSELLIETMEAMRMKVKLDTIYTRVGDSGETQLGDASTVAKTDVRVRAGGTFDELNAQIGLALATGDLPEPYVGWLGQIQNDLFDLGGELSVPAADSPQGRSRIGDSRVRWLEKRCDEVNADLPALPSFLLPGGNPGSSQLHACRTVCRRAELDVLEVGEVDAGIVRYLNRLSDLLFILARGADDRPERLWEPGGDVGNLRPLPH